MNAATQMKGGTKVWGNGWQIEGAHLEMRREQSGSRRSSETVGSDCSGLRLKNLHFYLCPHLCPRAYSSFNPSFGVFMLLIIHWHSGQTLRINYRWFCKRDDEWTAQKGLRDFRWSCSGEAFPPQTEHVCYDGGHLGSPAVRSRLAVNNDWTPDLMTLEGRKKDIQTADKCV